MIQKANLEKDQEHAQELQNLQLNETKNKSRKNTYKQELIILSLLESLTV